tara:strand:+ start:1709 stop:1885 length:177 start_codon:yes stop_codon:yes gene_type:complete
MEAQIYVLYKNSDAIVVKVMKSVIIELKPVVIMEKQFVHITTRTTLRSEIIELQSDDY